MNKYIEKMAKQEKDDSGLKPHQEDALDKLEESGGVLLHHSTGSGKTKTFLEAIRRAQEKNKDAKALIIAPASLTTNIDKELLKHKIKLNRDNLEVYSYEKATNIADKLRKNHYDIVVADEAHKLRNNKSKRVKELRGIIGDADQRVLATATANYNHLADLSPLLNIVAGNQKLLPEDRKEVENKYIQKIITKPGFIGRLMGKQPVENEKLKNTKSLSDAFKDYVSYYDSREDPKAANKFPTKEEHQIDVEMSPEQEKYYKYVEGTIPFMTRMKIRHNLPLSQKEKADINAFSMGVRQVSNSYKHLREKGDAEVTPKIKRAVNSLVKSSKEDKNHRGLVYSNFLGAGLEEYSSELKKRGIKHSLYTGSLSKTEKEQMVKDYNEGKVPNLLISSSGAEGIDLRGTKLIQVLEPHWNLAKVRQVVGRGVRYESHEHLPKEERHVKVEHYYSVYHKPMWGKAPYSIDKYLSENSDDKQDLFDQVKTLMKKNS